VAKSFRKVAIECLKKAYERELCQELESLNQGFQQWQRGEIDCWKLVDRIHDFHDGCSRNLYKIYETGDKKIALARAIALGFLKEQEVPAGLREPMSQTIEFFRGELGSSDLESP